MNNKKNRIHWIDISKALLIIMVVLCHTLRFGKLDVFVSSFEVPCFFLLAGITFKPKEISNNIKNNFKRIMIPYYFFGVFSIIVYCFIGNDVYSSLNINNGDTSFLNNIYGLLYCNCKNGLMRWNTPIYYLPSYFLTSFIVNILENIISKSKKKNLYRISFILVSLGISYFVTLHNEICLPLFGEASLYFSSFFEIGILIKKILLNEYDRIKIFFLLVPLLMLGVSISLINIPYGMHYFVLGKNYFLYTFNAFVLSICTILISKLINNSHLLSIVGNNTIGILCLHRFPVYFFVSYVPFIKTIMTSNVETIISDFCGILITLVSIFLCLVVNYIIMKTCPFVFGEKK